MYRLLFTIVLIVPNIAMAAFFIERTVPVVDTAQRLAPKATPRALAQSEAGGQHASDIVISPAVLKNLPASNAVLQAEAVPPSPLTPRWTIAKGQPIHLALTAWANSAGWTFLWYPTVSWKSINDVDLKDKKDVVSAISEVITILRDEGKAVQLRVSDGNNVMEVLSTEVKND